MSQLGRTSFAQRLLVRRVARLALQAELFDRKLTAGKFTDYDGKVYGGVLNALRLCLKELGVRPPAEKPSSLAEVLSRHQGGRT